MQRSYATPDGLGMPYLPESVQSVGNDVLHLRAVSRGKDYGIHGLCKVPVRHQHTLSYAS